MPRRRNYGEEVLAEVSEELGWTKAKRIEVLLKFVDENDMSADLAEYVENYAENEREDEDEEEDDGLS